MSTATLRPGRRLRDGGGWRDGGGDGGGGRHPLPGGAYRMGVLFALAGIAMLFVALTSAYVVRQGLDPDWRAIRMPPILWLTTGVLAASSITIEVARRRSTSAWLSATLALGLVFLGGQLAAWRQLAASGIYLSTNPHSSFFYLLTGLHGVHLLGGIAALSWVLFRNKRGSALGATALYWHFMDVLWLYLFMLLFAWR